MTTLESLALFQKLDHLIASDLPFITAAPSRDMIHAHHAPSTYA